MAADSTTDDSKATQLAGGNAIGGSSDGNDATVTDAGVNQPHQINLKGFPSSKDMENDKGNSLRLESMEVREKEASHHGENAAEILMQEPEKPDIQSVGIQSKVQADPHEENDFVHSPGAAPRVFPGDAGTSDFASHCQKIDEEDLKDPNQEQDSVTLKVEAQQQADGIATKEMDVDNGLGHVKSSSVVGPMVGKFEDKCFNNKEMPGLELVTENETKKEFDSASMDMGVEPNNVVDREFVNQEQNVPPGADMKTASNVFLLDKNAFLGNETETEENQAAFMKELEAFHKERFLEFKPPKFYGEPLNCLKLWKAVIKLGGYEQVTACKLWRQVGESFNPPKTCTTVSWTFRGFYEKALLEYEKHKMHSGELPSDVSFAEPSGTGNQAGHSQSSGSGRARRDAAARAMQGWHSQRLLSNGEVGDSIIKDKNSISTIKREKQLKSVGLLKRKKVSPVEHPVHIASLKTSKPQLETMVVDIGAPADWVKINVQRTKDCFEVYALVPGLLREEVRVQSDPAGRLVISGEPEQLDNPWGVTPFKKVVSLPSRIDPHQTSAVVTLHGQLFVRVPFEQPDI